MSKILIFNPFGIGDVLFTTPLIRNLKENLIPFAGIPRATPVDWWRKASPWRKGTSPALSGRNKKDPRALPVRAPEDVSISYLCNRRVEPLLKTNPFLDKVFIFEKDEWKDTLKKSKLGFLKKAAAFFVQIKKEGFDMVFDLSLNSQYGLFLMLAGIPRRIGFNFKNRGRFLTHKIDIPNGYSRQHVARYHLSLLKFLNITPKEYKFDLFIPAENLVKAREALAAYGWGVNDLLVGICPGSGDSWRSTAYYKRWPAEYFLKLCAQLQQELGARLILLGSQAEEEICEYIHTNLQGRSLNLCAKLSLEGFAALVSLCKLIITNDGGPFHIAQALEKKAIVFFGPVDERVYGAYPDEDKSLVFTSDVSCRPCYKAFKFTGCPSDKVCLRKIGVNEVFDIVKNLLTLPDN